ncbi:SGNH/GDSL hydrolase family protein [Streptomyces yaanensis]|uniref:SGNH/GDSL hydrolase family protein n=1 Tax=Streptomyces yaanensis TaxID=1142239 RepID=A0ABV7S7Z8_9ACTN|nr:SGNH/GDSL hydrolase family protein [Streptomyces sp. CGMCC 4.7035]WNB99924.1 SGNH/GDSL hydrolase family protein [Streptomyces sp. CGMCC 4.7035]
MRQSRITACISSLLLAAACTVTGATTAQAAPEARATGYVALGDSYSAGVGAGSYLGSSVECLRSSQSYPALWAAAHAPSSFTFTACNGARTSDVMAGQLGALSTRTGLVSITVGGSDSGFSDVMMTCVLRGHSACLSAVAKARSYMDAALPGNLDRLYTAIRRKAPAARVVVLGYPHLYKLHGTCSAGLSDSERSAINNAVDHLNGVIAKRVADHGFTFGDVRSAFSGHEICSSSPWMRSVNWLAVTESYHPTALGQSRGYLRVFTGAA